MRVNTHQSRPAILIEEKRLPASDDVLREYDISGPQPSTGKIHSLILARPPDQQNVTRYGAKNPRLGVA
jgi:hypothetical protein